MLFKKPTWGDFFSPPWEEDVLPSLHLRLETVCRSSQEINAADILDLNDWQATLINMKDWGQREQFVWLFTRL